MDDGTRNFFARTLQECRRLSKCKSFEAALVARGEDILGLSYSFAVVPETKFYNSPVIDAITMFLRKETVIVLPAILFSTYFPSYEELIVAHSAGIKEIYHFGDISDSRCVKFLNAHADFCSSSAASKNGFKVFKLEMQK